MATVAEFSVPTESFALAETLPAFPDVAVEVDRVAAHTPGTTMPCVWASDGDAAGFDDAIAADPTVERIQATAAFDGQRLYHIEWHDEIDRLVNEMIDHEGVIVEAWGRGDRWRLRIRFMTREQFETFREHFDEGEPSFRLEQLFDAEHPRHTRGDVTSAQHEALTTAAAAGYFEVPRDVSTREVADELDVSHQAVSERIRRGTDSLVRDMLFVEPIRNDE